MDNTLETEPPSKIPAAEPTSKHETDTSPEPSAPKMENYIDYIYPVYNVR